MFYSLWDVRFVLVERSAFKSLFLQQEPGRLVLVFFVKIQIECARQSCARCRPSTTYQRQSPQARTDRLLTIDEASDVPLAPRGRWS